MDPSPSSALAETAARFVESLGKLGTGETATMLAPGSTFHCRIRSDSLPIKKEMSGAEFCEVLQPGMHAIFPGGVQHEAKSVIVAGK